MCKFNVYIYISYNHKKMIEESKNDVCDVRVYRIETKWKSVQAKLCNDNFQVYSVVTVLFSISVFVFRQNVVQTDENLKKRVVWYDIENVLVPLIFSFFLRVE